eukprot:1826201-Prorocentrum_lima.AAC.1
MPGCPMLFRHDALRHRRGTATLAERPIATCEAEKLLLSKIEGRQRAGSESDFTRVLLTEKSGIRSARLAALEAWRG